ncbi:MAG: hypothetical protein M3N41_04470 [Acidobacteriota bacterium]|nr:hypothetical protein [Acidobacteriota bacterium]
MIHPNAVDNDRRTQVVDDQATLNFRADHTTVLVGGDNDGALVGRWSGDTGRLALDLSDDFNDIARMQGSAINGVLKLSGTTVSEGGSRFGRLKEQSYVCHGNTPTTLEPTIKFLNRYNIPITIEIYESKTSFPSASDELLSSGLLKPNESKVVSCQNRVGLSFRWRTDDGNGFGGFYGADCNVHPSGSHDAFDNPARQKVVIP